MKNVVGSLVVFGALSAWGYSSPSPGPSSSASPGPTQSPAPTSTPKPSLSPSPTGSPSPSATPITTMPIRVRDLLARGVALSPYHRQLIQMLQSKGVSTVFAAILNRPTGGYLQFRMPSGVVASVESVTYGNAIGGITTTITQGLGPTSLVPYPNLANDIQRGGQCWVMAAYHSRQQTGDVPHWQSNADRKAELDRMIQSVSPENRGNADGIAQAHGANFGPPSSGSLNSAEDCQKLKEQLDERQEKNTNPRNDCTLLLSVSLSDGQGGWNDFHHAVNGLTAQLSEDGKSCELLATDTFTQGDMNGNLPTSTPQSQNWTSNFGGGGTSPVPDRVKLRKVEYQCQEYLN